MTLAGIGIIGGADGPTAVFITGSPWMIVAEVLVIAAAIAGAILLFRSARKKKK